ncbi:DJ-1 family glyoxalase III [Helicobacter sp. 13S00477-4]|uniref:DJ-1 family glyoxalase III n=1 Tax=Helicobacter sp. 13S00477-4 TaxID=1905759 RepID=UPI000BA53628|nr:DJ-1 family glyoxalase III [Helicobacter sp. 13S00477-4]PAF51533.1 DJ-1 family protein [Helicobacter sp. 13S00477-4]
MNKKILVPLANGFEEAEFIGIVDVLRRAEVEVIVAGLQGDSLYTGANRVQIKADESLKNIEPSEFDGIVLPGGFEGMDNLKSDDTIIKIIKDFHFKKKLVCAMCASPIVLHHAGVLEGRDFTCYPGCETGLDGKRHNQAVVVREHIITSAGPATAILFGLEIVKLLCGQETYKALFEGLLVPLTLSIES